MKRSNIVCRAVMALFASSALILGLAPSASASTTGPIDFIDITTWGYDKISPEIYEGNLVEPTNFYIYARSKSQGEQVIGQGCVTTITVRGYFGLIGDNNRGERCSTENPGVRFKVPFDGKYLITVAVTQPGRAPFVASKEIFIGPFAVVPAAIDSGSAAVGLPTGSSTTGSTG